LRAKYDGPPTGWRPMNHWPTVPQPILDSAAAGDDSLLAAIRERGGTPLEDGRSSTFLFVGEAEAVGLHHWMDVFRPLPPFERVPGTPLWALTVQLPEESRIEYKLSIKRHGRRRLVLDHLNPRRARDPFGTNSLVTGPGYVRPEWSLPADSVPAGTLQSIEIESAAFGDTRTARLYLPRGVDRQPIPLLIAHDGSEYAEFASLTVVLDNLIDAGDLPPLACVLSDPGDRNREYTADERHAAHIVDELIPAVAERVSLDPRRRVCLGASLGGVASLHAAWLYPGVFSGLVLQSGSFVTALGGRNRRGPVFAPVVEFMREFRSQRRPLPPRIHISCGRFDGLIVENRVMASLLRAGGAEVGYDEAPDGHNWENWRDRLRAGLFHTLSE